MKCLLPCFDVVTVSHKIVGLERMLDYGGVGLQGFHCHSIVIYACKFHSVYNIVFILYLTKSKVQICTIFTVKPVTVSDTQCLQNMSDYRFEGCWITE